jgi:tetratricopeptide (TPR) repeat protein
MTICARRIALLAISTFFLFSTGCANIGSVSGPSDKPLKAFRRELLETAFKTATAIPLEPHIKDRARIQEEVVKACLALDQPRLALGYIAQIPDWRRGAAYADLAIYCIRHGRTKDVQQYLDRASAVSELADQEWRRDAVRVKISQAHVLLGQSENAAHFEKDLEPSETGKVAAARAMVAGEAAFDKQMKAIDALVATGNYDIIINCLDSYAELFNRFYKDPKRRAKAEERIKASWSRMPIFIRFEVLTKLAGFALDHADKEKALTVAAELQQFLDGNQWDAEHRIPMMARLAELRFRAGDKKGSRAGVDQATDIFNLHSTEILSIYRGGALRPLAQAYQSMGDTAKALEIYRQAIEHGVENLNSRPRAEDLSLTCVSMAINAVEPDDSLWVRIRQIFSGLRDPW